MYINLFTGKEINKVEEAQNANRAVLSLHSEVIDSLRSRRSEDYSSLVTIYQDILNKSLGVISKENRKMLVDDVALQFRTMIADPIQVLGAAQLKQLGDQYASFIASVTDDSAKEYKKFKSEVLAPALAKFVQQVDSNDIRPAIELATKYQALLLSTLKDTKEYSIQLQGIIDPMKKNLLTIVSTKQTEMYREMEDVIDIFSKFGMNKEAEYKTLLAKLMDMLNQDILALYAKFDDQLKSFGEFPLVARYQHKTITDLHNKMYDAYLTLKTGK